ncbi:MAG: hypothetical protein H0X30_13075 [Anaerolineae bacterium]|nr:hypothetical protein [Anaerolineae bacterium]
MSLSAHHPQPKIMAMMAAAMHKLHGGGNSRAIRCICVISAAAAELPADTKCQFGGFSPASRHAIQREICKLCNIRRICRIF